MKNQIIPNAEIIPASEYLSGDVCYFQVRGENLEPDISRGSYVAAKKVIGWQDYFGYGYFNVVILVDGRTLFKKITKSKEDPLRNVLCVSYHPDLIEQELPRHLIQEVYRIVGQVKFF